MGGGGNSYECLESVRLARRAQERYLGGGIAEAFADINESLRRNPQDEQIKNLYETLASHAVEQLIEQGSLDQAAEIAETARGTLPGSKTLERCGTRVMVRRLGPDKLVSEDPEEIASLVTLLENWLGEDPRDQELRRQARYAAVIDPDLYNEMQFDQVAALMDPGRMAHGPGTAGGSDPARPRRRPESSTWRRGATCAWRNSTGPGRGGGTGRGVPVRPRFPRPPRRCVVGDGPLRGGRRGPDPLPGAGRRGHEGGPRPRLQRLAGRPVRRRPLLPADRPRGRSRHHRDRHARGAFASSTWAARPRAQPSWLRPTPRFSRTPGTLQLLL